MYYPEAPNVFFHLHFLTVLGKVSCLSSFQFTPKLRKRVVCLHFPVLQVTYGPKTNVKGTKSKGRAGDVLLRMF